MEDVKIDISLGKGENNIKENLHVCCKTEQLCSSSESQDFLCHFKGIGKIAERL